MVTILIICMMGISITLMVIMSMNMFYRLMRLTQTSVLRITIAAVTNRAMCMGRVAVMKPSLMVITLIIWLMGIFITLMAIIVIIMVR